MNWSLIVASNSEEILKNCLAGSPCVSSAKELHVMRGFSSAAAAYNAGMLKASGDILVFAHQDVYLPKGWDRCLAQSIARLSESDPNWGVLGVWGITLRREPRGFAYCTGLQKVLGNDFEDPIRCISLDEVVLILRRASGLRFDELLPGYHLYGTDICLKAKQRGMNAYIIPAFCIHNTEGLKFLPWAFVRAYFYMRRKWRQELPVRTPCTVVESIPVQLVEHSLRSAYSHWIKREEPGRRVDAPRVIYEGLVRSGRLSRSVKAGTASS